jgi:predicted metal-binding membrane protein
MADRVGPAAGAAGAAGAPALRALRPRQFAAPWIAVAALAAVAWAVTVMLARDMGNGPGTMGLALLPFVGVWAVMMAAMMLPSAAPVAVLWTRLISGSSAGARRAARTGMFLGGYLLVWAAIGAVAFAALAGTGRLATASPTAAKWLGVAIFIAAGGYQLTPWKDVCLRRCRSPVGALMHYAGYQGRGRDLRVGVHHGATCAGCCWGLMIVLVAVGVMNLAVMAALAVVVFAEKLWRHGKPFGLAVGVVLAAVGVLAIWFPWLLPGLHVAAMPAMPAMLFQGIQQLQAGLFAAPARLRADPAMRVHPGVPLALVAAASADRHARLKQRLGDAGGVVRGTAGDVGGDGADVGAVQAQPDAPDHLADVLLAQVGVGVGDAGLRALSHRVDGRGQHVRVNVQGGWVGV